MRVEKSENDYEELNKRYEILVKIVNSIISTKMKIVMII